MVTRRSGELSSGAVRESEPSRAALKAHRTNPSGGPSRRSERPSKRLQATWCWPAHGTESGEIGPNVSNVAQGHPHGCDGRTRDRHTSGQSRPTALQRRRRRLPRRRWLFGPMLALPRPMVLYSLTRLSARAGTPSRRNKDFLGPRRRPSPAGAPGCFRQPRPGRLKQAKARLILHQIAAQGQSEEPNVAGSCRSIRCESQL